ncbi:MAG: hypothetical protein H6Q73_157 [Firmicutes bacterium]|nr:hypothetical protein [Bacillota bacterium]
MSDNSFRLTVCILLAGILFVQIIGTFINKPPTYGDFVNAKQPELKKQLSLKVPLAHAQLNEPISVEITNTPLDVDVTSMP